MTTRWLGIAALGCFAVHGSYHVFARRWPDVLWGCHIAAVLIGVGALLERAELVAIGVLWLCFGNPLWILDITTGGELLPTSLFTHVGGLAIGLAVLNRLGMPRHAWLYATAAFLGLLLLTRLITPRAANVNLAFAVASGWEETFPSYSLYLLLMIAAGIATFAAAEFGLRKVLE
ncbi:MAG TPA: hypothetical protein VHB79_00325 [Polyangiaceae bacterium]|nr:hypothetical protein [Polyangiaceae bacterium]